MLLLIVIKVSIYFIDIQMCMFLVLLLLLRVCFLLIGLVLINVFNLFLNYISIYQYKTLSLIK